MRSTTGAPVPVVMSALWDTAVPVPRMRGLCEDDRVNGAPFARSVEVGVHPGSRRRGPGVIATARGS